MNSSKADSQAKTVYVFIDASNLWAAQKAKGRLFDLEKLKDYLKNKHDANQIRVYYYDAYPDQKTREYSVAGKFKFYVYLEKALKFVVRKKPLKQIRVMVGDEVVIEEKGNMDVEMAIDVVNQLSRYDDAVFFSGDSDFLALIRFVRNKGKRVYVYSSRNNISTELRTGADGYTDVLKISDDIWRAEVAHREGVNKNNPQ